MPAKETTYLCTLMELPKEFKNKTHYIVQVCLLVTSDNIMLLISLQYSAVITPESRRHVHHMVVYLCDGMNLTGSPDLNIKQECDGISEQTQPCRASTVIAAWAVGGNYVRH